MAERSESWVDLIAVGLVADSMNPIAIARYAGVSLSVASAAIEHAEIEGVLVEGVVDSDLATRLIADLPAGHLGDIHAAIARHLLSEGPDRLPAAVHHLQTAGQLMPHEDLVDLAEQGGRTALSVNDYRPAQQLLAFADELDPATNPSRRA